MDLCIFILRQIHSQRPDQFRKDFILQIINRNKDLLYIQLLTDPEIHSRVKGRDIFYLNRILYLPLDQI